MDIHKEFAEWAVARGIKVNGIAAHRFPGRGLGIIAEKNFKAEDTLLTVPTTALRTILTVPKSISKPIGKINVHGVLAAELALDNSDSRACWRSVLPSVNDFKESMPLLWDAELQALLPTAASSLLQNQQKKLSKDWSSVSAAFPNLSYEHYVYNWLIVNTRTFYFTSPQIKLKAPINRDDCMALNPFADYFNHADVESASASFSPSGYTMTASRCIKQGDEIYISYGNHSNDFLLAEYGFVMESNKWDEISLDKLILPMFSDQQMVKLEETGFLGKYVLDGKGVCYRTQVALRLLFIPANKWQKLVGTGLEDGDQYQETVDDILLKILTALTEKADETLESIKGLECGLPSQRETLSRRWNQIRLLLNTAMKG